MTDCSPNNWTLAVLLDANWESVAYASREAAVSTLESIVDDYGERVAMAHFVGPESKMEVANLHEIRSRRASRTELASRDLNSRPNA
jgi:cob(I)alamin adenosyltransferase